MKDLRPIWTALTLAQCSLTDNTVSEGEHISQTIFVHFRRWRANYALLFAMALARNFGSLYLAYRKRDMVTKRLID